MGKHYTAGGVLILQRVTPIITALFEGYLACRHSRKGQASLAFTIASIPSWARILGNLAALGVRQGILPPKKKHPQPEPLLLAWARHFHVEQDKTLLELIEYERFDREAELDPLFFLATRFDDGHRLTAIETADGWTGDRPPRPGFGATTTFYSREFCLESRIEDFQELAGCLHETLRRQALDETAGYIALETWRLIEGILDGAVRDAVLARVIERLTPEPEA
jgi:hypothetical protein